MRYTSLTMWIAVTVVIHSARGQWSEPVPLAGPITGDPSLMKWPSINATDDTLYYAKTSGGGNEDICYSYRLTDSTWSAPICLPQGTINSSLAEVSPCIGPGDSLLYFVAWGRPGGYGSWDIWFSRRLPDGRWGPPENAGPNVNTAAMEWGVFLSRDGRSLYFSSDHYPSDFLDIYKSVWQDSGGWGPAVRLPGQVNWFTDDQNVTLPADESFLILTSLRYSPSDMDFYYSSIDNGNWSEAMRIPELSTNGREAGASLTPDGLTVYLASARVDSLPYSPHLYVSYRQNPVAPQRPTRPRMGQIRIYPNPVNGSIITFDFNGQPRDPFWSHPFFVYVYDVLGRRTNLGVKTFHATNTSFQISFSALPTGKYWLWLDNGYEPLSAPFVILK